MAESPADKHRKTANENPLGWFENLYRDADRNADHIPWADDRANPNLTAWAETQGAEILKSAASALVVGCGLGDDAEYLAAKVTDVTAFDISPEAIAWARERFPGSRVKYTVEDLFRIPTSCDFVFESYTIQALPPQLRPQALARLPELVRPGGRLLVICRGRSDHEVPGELPPWPLSPADLKILEERLALEKFEDYIDTEDGGIRRFRVLYRKPA